MSLSGGGMLSTSCMVRTIKVSDYLIGCLKYIYMQNYFPETAWSLDWYITWINYRVFTISAPDIILWHSYSLPSLVFLLPTPPPLFCLNSLSGLFLHSHHPFSIFIFSVCYQLHSRLLLFHFIIVIYMHRGYFFMFCYFYLVFCVVKRLRVNIFDRTLYKFWYYYYYYY
jgi:hypothetical protein